MEINIYDKVLLKNGRTAHIVEIWDLGVAYEADIDIGHGEYVTGTIKHNDIVERAFNMNCFLCKGDMESGLTTHTVDLKSCIVIIRDVPAMVCTQCGEVWYNGTVTREVEKIVDAVTATALAEIAVVNYSANVA